MTTLLESLIPQRRIKRPALNFTVLGVIVLVMAIGGGSLVMRFSKIEEQRELVQWQNKLNLIADSRAADLEKWLNTYFQELGAVTANPSLQLYLTTLLAPPASDSPAPEEPAEKVFLRNLLVMTGDRLGFIDSAPSERKTIHANVAQPTGTGLALIGMDGKVLVATAGLSAPSPALAAKIAEAPKGKTTLLDISKAEDGSQEIGFILPIYPIQSDASAEQQMAKLVGVRKIGSDFTALLRQPGVTEETLEALLLRREGENVSYLVPNTSGTASSLSLTTPDLDAAQAITEPGTFTQARDAAFKPTLMTSRAIAGSPWVMMLHINRDQAMAESDAWRRQTQMIMFFALLAALSSLIAVWYYGTSKRIWFLSMETGRLAKRLTAQEKLLRVVADHQLEPILLVDPINVVHFANEPAANAFHMIPADVVSKDLVALMGPARGSDYSEANKTALVSGEPLLRTWHKEQDGSEQVIRTIHIPLQTLPIDHLPEATPGVLIIDQDITEVVSERERRLGLSGQLINTLVAMVDKRDHNAAHHSAGVALLAREIAEGMALGALLIETAETAGKLMNIGKIVVPPELLTKTEPLAQDEKTFIRESLQRSADLIQNIPFDGPVVETLRQAQEHFDGTGPLQLKGETILVTARIIAVANAFVGMVSPRTYRPTTISMEQAISTLLQDNDAQYDQRVIVTLAHFMENKRGKETLTKLIAKEE